MEVKREWEQESHSRTPLLLRDKPTDKLREDVVSLAWVITSENSNSNCYRCEGSSIRRRRWRRVVWRDRTTCTDGQIQSSWWDADTTRDSTGLWAWATLTTVARSSSRVQS